MRYVFDHDYHIHSFLSDCSNDSAEDTKRILEYAGQNDLKQICLTDHFWDEAVPGASEWYKPQNYKHISQALPLPQTEKNRFLFGCETDMDRYMTLGISRERFESFDFVVIPTTHLHMNDLTIAPEDRNVEGRAKCWVNRLEKVLNMQLPFHKIGIAHLVTSLIAPDSREEFLAVLRMLPETDMGRLFTKAASLGVGIELNSFDVRCTEKEAETILRPLQIAKQCGCKFYMGSDAHHPADLDEAKAMFERAIDWLELTEDDKFVLTLN